MNVGIREAEGDEDLAFMLDLSPRLAGVIETGTHSAEEIAAFQRDYSTANLREPPAGAISLIASDEGGKRLGFLHALPSPDGITGATIGYIALLAVTETAEGRGVAGRLMEAAQDWARRSGYRALALDVFASNGRGRQFYEKNGFAVETMRMVRPV